MKRLSMGLTFFMLAGCVSVPDVKIESETGSIRVPSGENVCVVFPENGRFDGKEHEESGNKVGGIILKSIPKDYKAFSVDFAKDCNGDYLLTSEILEYENRASGWSGMPDKIKVKVLLTYTKEDKYSSFTYYADSNMAVSAFFEWGNAAPYELLGSEFRDRVGSLVIGE